MKKIRRIYKGMPVKDAKANLTIVVLERDRNGAIRKDPTCCVFAQACKRLFRGDAVFYKKIAYIELPDADGTRYVHRYKLTESAMRYVAEYDRTGKFKAGISVNLLKPPKSCTLDQMQKYHYAHQEKVNAIKRLKRKHGIKGRRYIINKPRVYDTDIRNGTGMMRLLTRGE